jgi:hypothetical protein
MEPRSILLIVKLVFFLIEFELELKPWKKIRTKVQIRLGKRSWMLKKKKEVGK